ncbi:hypothetical protein UFOVP600_37 [uncultured Caudovirales phage]|uniref:Uncharacterized protein n=1 Tax=uncultured Caudovirales phage TaxID=2100421 RepID=A0A6J5MZI4_9CAUD|nr:hypothetical protein UFOVP600_37 [uncultured Caudovirales phage]
MKASEKALELFNKMSRETVHVESTKQCAIIAIYELQEFITKYNNHVPDFKYWEEVIKEIENL